MASTATARRPGVSDYFALNRNVAAVASIIAVMTFGESLWKRFLPKYLEQLGAPISAIGLFGTTEDLLDGVYQYPGGWLGDKLGRRAALRIFIAVAAVGYLLYWVAPSWPWLFAGQLFVMAWASMASPTLFSVVADVLPSHQRAMGFTVQAVVKRIPLAAGPTVGGLVIAAAGIAMGVRSLLLVSLIVAALAWTVALTIRIDPIVDGSATTMRDVWGRLPPPLRRLLLSDVFIRTCEGMVDVFLVLYVTNVARLSSPQFGALLAVQAITSALVYLPAARLAGRFGKKPFVVMTFVCFALFPLGTVLSSSLWGMTAAFVIGGLRELGEPARKAMILDFAEPHIRARTVGLYYLIRSLAISPAAFVGGLLWKLSPAAPFFVASAFGFVGVIVFAMSVDERHAA